MESRRPLCLCRTGCCSVKANIVVGMAWYGIITVCYDRFSATLASLCARRSITFSITPETEPDTEQHTTQIHLKGMTENTPKRTRKGLWSDMVCKAQKRASVKHTIPQYARSMICSSCPSACKRHSESPARVRARISAIPRSNIGAYCKLVALRAMSPWYFFGEHSSFTVRMTVVSRLVELILR